LNLFLEFGGVAVAATVAGIVFTALISSFGNPFGIPFDNSFGNSFGNPFGVCLDDGDGDGDGEADADAEDDVDEDEGDIRSEELDNTFCFGFNGGDPFATFFVMIGVVDTDDVNEWMIGEDECDEEEDEDDEDDEDEGESFPLRPLFVLFVVFSVTSTILLRFSCMMVLITLSSLRVASISKTPSATCDLKAFLPNVLALRPKRRDSLMLLGFVGSMLRGGRTVKLFVFCSFGCLSPVSSDISWTCKARCTGRRNSNDGPNERCLCCGCVAIAFFFFFFSGLPMDS